MNAAARKLGNTQVSSDGGVTTLVYGLGSTGLSVARYLERQGLDALYFDSRAAPPGLDTLKSLLPDAEVLLDELPDEALDGLERAVVSPGIGEADPHLARLRAAGLDIVSDIELFVDAASADFIAVSGSNGKSTVTTLIALMCESAGRRVLAGGNLGRPALDLLGEDRPDLYVLELSSFQLQRTRRLPAKVSVLLNVSADHLDWHRSEAEYRAAKYRIFDEADAAVINRDDTLVGRGLRDGLQTISFGLDAPAPGQYGIRIDAGVEYLARGAECLLPADAVAMTGRHNLANALAAMAAGELAGLPQASMLGVLREFPGLPHRMQFVRELAGVRYVNDSKATNVDAAIAAVRSVADPVVLLAGGQGKGGDFDSFAAAVATELRAVIVFGEDAGRLARAFRGRAEVIPVGDLAQAIARARNVAERGDTVLLAPACASFDQFANYLQRGDVFCAAVRSLPG